MTATGEHEDLSGGGRREAIQSLLLERQEVTVNELVERFGVSVMTVHRDLDTLEERGVLRKVRGGATAQPSSHYESSLAFRISEESQAKAAIGRAAAQHVVSGSSVFLDDSTTVLPMLPQLAMLPQLTIMSNFATLVDRIRALTDESIEVIGVGGTYRRKYDSFGGAITENWLRQFHVDQSFLSVSAVDPARGAFHREADHAALKRAMVEIADRTVLLLDSSKLAKRALHRIAPIDAFDLVIVDEETPDEAVRDLRAQGVDVEVAAHAAVGLDGDGRDGSSGG